MFFKYGDIWKGGKKSVTDPANILGVICCTSQISSTKAAGIVGWVCDLIWSRNRGYGVLGSCIVRNFGAINGHVRD